VCSSDLHLFTGLGARLHRMAARTRRGARMIPETGHPALANTPSHGPAASALNAYANWGEEFLGDEARPQAP
jgi:hypothetical protein